MPPPPVMTISAADAAPSPTLMMPAVAIASPTLTLPVMPAVPVTVMPPAVLRSPVVPSMVRLPPPTSTAVASDPSASTARSSTASEVVAVVAVMVPFVTMLPVSVAIVTFAVPATGRSSVCPMATYSAVSVSPKAAIIPPPPSSTVRAASIITLLSNFASCVDSKSLLKVTPSLKTLVPFTMSSGVEALFDGSPMTTCSNVFLLPGNLGVDMMCNLRVCAHARTREQVV